jgi:hypothetical protein
MGAIELLEGLISDLEDRINDYEDDLKRGMLTRVQQYETKIRIDELKDWKKSLKIILEEQKDEN